MQKEKIFELIEESQYMKEIPKDIGEILALLHNPLEVDIDLLMEKVSKSEKLNSLVLKNLNSGYFQFKKEIVSVKEAILYLGMQTVQNLLIFFITLQLFPKSIPNRDRTFKMSAYWKHVYGTSVASCMIAAHINKGDKYKLFSYGLIHDIGIVVLDTCIPQLIDEITDKLLNGVHQVVAERVILDGMTHADIGSWICRKWNIRDDIINIVEFHHTPFFAKANLEEVQIMYVADIISTQYYEKLLGVNLNHEISNRVMEALGLTKEIIDAVVRDLPKEIEKANKYVLV